MEKCPIETALRYIGKKWTFEIVRDLFFGRTHFNEFLESNPSLSGKVLSERLKELIENGIIEKKVLNSFPISVEYNLTKKGRALNKVIYELAIFALTTCSEYNGNKCNNSHITKDLDNLKKVLKIDV
jgi:DNA-binding HxlR family transcriptional regulator